MIVFLLQSLTIQDLLDHWVFYLIDSKGKAFEILPGRIFITQDFNHLRFVRSQAEQLQKKPYHLRSCHVDNIPCVNES